MNKLLKPLSILNIVIGVLSILSGIAVFALGDVMSNGAATDLGQQVVILFKVNAVVAILAGLFDLASGSAGLKGAGGDQKKLHTARTLAYLSVAAAVISAIMTVYGSFTVSNAVSALCSLIIPVLFLMSVKAEINNR